MKKITILSVFGGLALMTASPVFANVSVSFVEPEHYTDLRQNEFGYGAKTQERILDKLRAHLEELGAEHLADNQSLSIEVLNIDLAGRYEPFLLGNYDGRLVDRVTWPSMKLRYVLSENGEEVLSGEERIADLSYLEHTNYRNTSDSLRYEKAMLDEWFYERFVQKKALRK